MFSSFPADLFLPITPFTKKRKRPSNTKHIDKTQLRKYKPQPAANLRQQLCRARSISFYSSLYYVIYEQSKHAFPTRKYGGMNLNLRRQLWRAHSISFYCFFCHAIHKQAREMFFQHKTYRTNANMEVPISPCVHKCSAHIQYPSIFFYHRIHKQKKKMSFQHVTYQANSTSVHNCGECIFYLAQIMDRWF